MNDQVKGTMVGDPVDAPTKPPKTRTERIAEWRVANRETYERAVNAQHDACCSPTRANQMIIDQYNNPPID